MLTPGRWRLLREGAWVFSGQVLAAFGTLVGIRLLTEVVPPEVFGTVALAAGLVALATVLTAGPLCQAALRFWPDYAAGARTAELRWAVAQQVLRVAAKAALIVVPAIALWLLAWGGSALLAVLCLLLFALEAMRSFTLTFLNAARDQRALAAVYAAEAWLRPLAAVATVAALGPSPESVVAGFIVGVAAAALPWLFARGLHRRPRHGAGALHPAVDTGALWRFAVPLVPVPLLGWVTQTSDRYLLGGLVGLEAAGLYAALYGLVSRPFLMMTGIVELVLRQPHYELVSARRIRDERLLLAAWFATLLAGSLLLLALFALFHRPIASLLLAEPYREHSALSLWIAAGFVLAACSYAAERVCYAWGDTRGVLLIEAAAAVASLALAVPLILAFGLAGAAWAVPGYFGVRLVVAVARAFSVRRRALRAGAVVAVSDLRPREASEQ